MITGSGTSGYSIHIEVQEQEGKSQVLVFLPQCPETLPRDKGLLSACGIWVKEHPYIEECEREPSEA